MPYPDTERKTKRQPYSDTEKEAKRQENAHRFDWWWLDAAAALDRPFPNTPLAYRKNLFRQKLNEAAFLYEATARREMQNGKKGKPSYEFNKPFNELTADLIDKLRRRWPTPPNAPDAFAFWDAYADPFFETRASLNQLDRSIVVSRTDRLHDHAEGEKLCESKIERLVARGAKRDELLSRYTRPGWTPPGWFSFNLAGCSNRTIIDKMTEWLANERQRSGIVEPAANTGRRNHSKRDGRSFHVIEGIDVASHYPPKEAKALGYDPASISKLKKKAVTAWNERKNAGLKRFRRGGLNGVMQEIEVASEDGKIKRMRVVYREIDGRWQEVDEPWQEVEAAR